MGAAITRAFAEEGVDLALFGRDTDAIAPVAAECRAMGRRVEVFACDVTDAAAVDAAVAKVAEAFGRIDILVNVAGGTGPDRQDRGPRPPPRSMTRSSRSTWAGRST